MKNMVALLTGTAGLALLAQAATAQEFTFTFAHVLTEDTPNHQASLDFAERVSERSDGRIEINVVPAAALGGDVEIIEQIQAGVVDIGIPPTATLGNFEPQMQILDLPYILPTDQVYEILDGEVGRRFLDLLEPHGMKGLSFWGAGWRHMTTNDRPIQSGEDLDGLRMRTMQSPIIIGHYDFWNANPTAMAFTEVYSALEQGVVDGQENPYANIYGMRFYEVQDYLTETAHSYHPYAAVISTSSWEALPDDLQEVMREAFEYGAERSRERTVEWEADIRDEIMDEIEIVELTEQQRAEFIDASLGVHEAFRDELGPELIDAIYEITGQGQN